MIKKILVTLVFIGLYHIGFAQAPGNDCASAVPITLFPGTTASTGFQEIPPSYDDTYNGTNCQAGTTWYGPGYDGVYSINVINPGEYKFGFANNGTTYKSLSVHAACPITNGVGNCIGGLGTSSSRDGGLGFTFDEILTPGIYYIVIDSFYPAATYPDLGLPAGVTNPAFELLITSPIANDECSNATELFSGVDCSFITYTNEDATASAGAPAPGCAYYQGGDVWFEYQVTDPNGEFTVTTEAGVMTDSGLAIYSGTCGALTQLGCNDNFSGSGYMSSLTITGRTLGEIVYIRVWEYGNNNNGTFGICVTTPLPPGDNGVYADCPNERGLELTSDFACPPGVNSANVVFGNLEGGALADRPNTFVSNSTTCGFAAGSSRRYHEIEFEVPTTGLYVLELTSSTFDGMAYIVETGFTPGVCGPGFVIADDDSGTGTAPELSVNLTAGVNYTLITTEWWGGGFGNSPYTWTVTSGQDIEWLTTIAIDWYTAETGGTYLKTGPGLSPVNFPNSGLTDTSTPGVYTYWYECTSNPGTRTPVDYIIGKTWKGTTSSDWNTASNWSGDTVPTDSQCVFIPAGTPNDPIIDDDVDGDGFSLTIRTGATLTLEGDDDASGYGSSLTIQDHITIEGTSTLTVEDGASLIQVNDTPAIANSGEIILNRNTDISKLDYVYWSSPVENYEISDIYGVFTPTNYMFDWTQTIPAGTVPGLPPTGGMPICYGNWTPYSTGFMSTGKGYAVRGPNNLNNTVSTVTATFNGVANNGVITQPIISGDNNITNNNYNLGSLTVTPLDDNWNLIGNPYPSALDANAFLTHPSNSIIEGAVHVWTHASDIGAFGDSFYEDFVFNYNTSDYITYNISGSSYPNETFAGQIASGQGFFVLALNDNESGSVTFNNSMRNKTYSNTDFYRTSSPSNNTIDANSIERNRIWLNLIGQNDATSSIMVGYIEGATQEKDRLFDAYTREVNSLNLYSKIGDERMIIQGRSLPFDDTDKVPLGVVIPQAGEYTIAISKIDGLFLDDNQNIYLEDTLTGTIHDLRATPYTFTETETVEYENRFYLKYTDEALSIDDSELSSIRIIAPKGDYIKISTDKNSINSVTVYDLLGRALIQNVNLNTAEFVINNNNLSSGSYIVKVGLSNGLSKTQKVILKR